MVDWLRLNEINKFSWVRKAIRCLWFAPPMHVILDTFAYNLPTLSNEQQKHRKLSESKWHLNSMKIVIEKKIFSSFKILFYSIIFILTQACTLDACIGSRTMNKVMYNNVQFVCYLLAKSLAHLLTKKKFSLLPFSNNDFFLFIVKWIFPSLNLRCHCIILFSYFCMCSECSIKKLFLWMCAPSITNTFKRSVNFA